MSTKITDMRLITHAKPMEFKPANTSVITINGPNGKMASLYADGTVEYGEGYTPDDAARTFWEALSRNMPGRWIPVHQLTAWANSLDGFHPNDVPDTCKTRDEIEELLMTRAQPLPPPDVVYVSTPTVGNFLEELQKFPRGYRLDFSPGDCEDVTSNAKIEVLEGTTSDGPGTVWIELQD